MYHSRAQRSFQGRMRVTKLKTMLVKRQFRNFPKIFFQLGLNQRRCFEGAGRGVRTPELFGK
ncbi:hypothetical protein Hdeb2414_s0055g00756431 [Helianthus debilis subsp. tardiflorus]